ncbi:hypothetical protein [Aliikangiella sp. G2MR2-5]|uniref:hypothetical protein n=1 Tax=Aliikangiella sp. G2MR2-5 TaxID=2788943 RepID=UPI0018ABB6E0|nr:hypothetical protein [Aliikangiella sp. G2MR2-5]
MEDKTFNISLKCLFCDSPLQGDADKEFKSGDLIECLECHEHNDYDALMDIAIEEGKEKVAEYAKDEIEKSLKKLFK